MIEKQDEDEFYLTCDVCGESAEEIFEEFYDAVRYKRERENGWRSVMDSNRSWHDVCPVCATPETLRKLKGG